MVNLMDVSFTHTDTAVSRCISVCLALIVLDRFADGRQREAGTRGVSRAVGKDQTLPGETMGYYFIFIYF